MASLDPVALFKEADQQGSIEVALPDHIKLALEGTLPPVKQKPQLTPLESAPNLPKQHDIKPAAPTPEGTAAAKPKV